MAFFGQYVIIEYEGRQLKYRLSNGKIVRMPKGLKSDMRYIRVFANFKSEDEARQSPYGQYVMRWNQVHKKNEDVTRAICNDDKSVAKMLTTQFCETNGARKYNVTIVEAQDKETGKWYLVQETRTLVL